MKIGEHIGKRAKFINKEGYFFETIIDDVSNLFVFDEKRGHNADPYFNKHPDEWNDELEKRCWYVSKHEVTLTKKVII